ncbi:MAG: 50S ribosomal protein L29 [Gemmatales bacterium]|nr:50S ribosomal protein L29 [Gemmatales bacterium]MCS7160678.1 50S ribosomal protein L29 [Gemmatales bacterium]MDW8175879.1 50S ribosomal protein L29 [Gemmatales bacterium]MDW8223239.1 50S ribosomal protein L29 [Gemmatales bacterium]
MAKPLKPKDLRQMSDEQLRLLYKERTRDLFALRVQASTQRRDVPMELRKARRDIARILTIQRERERQRLQQT